MIIVNRIDNNTYLIARASMNWPCYKIDHELITDYYAINYAHNYIFTIQLPIKHTDHYDLYRQ